MTDWRDKTTMERAEADEFDTSLTHITVSENRIHVEFRDAEDWKRIRREAGDEVILHEVYWDEVAGVEATTEHLYYMHIDVTVIEDDEEVEKRLYFLEDEEETLQDCLAAIRRRRNAYRQRHAAPGGTYSYAAVDASEGDEVELEDTDAEMHVEEAAEDHAEPASGPAAAEPEEKTPDQAAVEEAKKIVQTARNKLHGKTQQAGEAEQEQEAAGRREGAAEQEESGEDADGDDDAGDGEEDKVEDIVDDFLRD